MNTWDHRRSFQCAGFVEGPCFLKFEASCIWTQTVSVPFTWFVVAVNRRCRRLRFSHFIRSLESHRNAHHFTWWDLWIIIKKIVTLVPSIQVKDKPKMKAMRQNKLPHRSRKVLCDLETPHASTLGTSPTWALNKRGNGNKPDRINLSRLKNGISIIFL